MICVPKTELATLCLLLFCANEMVFGESATPVKQERRSVLKVQLRKEAAMASNRPYQPPPELSIRDPVKKEVTATLEVNFAKNVIEDAMCIDDGQRETHTVRTRTYNDRLVGGIIRGRPGDILRVHLKNMIAKSEHDEPYQQNKPNGFNITNLHTHGLHVSPKKSSDNIFLEIGPEESKKYCFDIPSNHTAGTFWYHAHRHGSVALQLTSGMAGPLLIEGGLDEVPEIAAAMRHGREKILVFQQIRFSLDEHGLGHVTKKDVYGAGEDPTPPITECTQFEATLINGINRPVIKMKPGEVQRWRCIHAGVIQKIPLAIVKADDDEKRWWLYEFALDGLPMYKIEKKKGVELWPGYRSDFLVKAPKKPGVYLLKQLPVPAEEGLNHAAEDEDFLAKIKVVNAPPVSMKLPDFRVTSAFAPMPIDESELANQFPQPIVFKANPPADEFSANGLEFNHDRIDLFPKLGTAEEWALSTLQEPHPFHIHVNPFEVIEPTTTGAKRYWRDTLVVRETNAPWNPIYIRMRFETFPGDTVLHCHNLVHEDQGMMMKVHICGAHPPDRCQCEQARGFSELPAEPPATKVLDINGEPRLLDKSSANKSILLFFRGTGCEHCRRQLDVLVKRRADIEAEHYKVIAICPDSPDQLRAGVASIDIQVPASFQLMSDQSLDAFQKYGCFDGRALHGLFIVDGGNIHWQHISDEPLMNIDKVLEKARSVRLRPQSRP